MKIFSLYTKIAELEIRIFLNQVLFYYRRIPVLNWLSPGSSYKMEGLKGFFSFFAPLGTIVVRFSKSILACGILAFISFIIGQLFKISNSIVFINWMLISVVLDISNFYYDDNKEKVIIHYNLFKVDPKLFTFSGILIQGFVNILGDFLALLLVGRILNIPPKILFGIGLLKYLSSIIYNGFNFYLFDKKVLNPKRYENYKIFNAILSFIFLFLIVFFNLDVVYIVTKPLFYIVGIILSIVSILYLKKFNRFTEVLLSFEERYSQNNKKTDKEKIEYHSSLKEKDLEISKSYIREGVKGYELLNETFFQRHRRIMLNPIQIKTLILGVILLLILTIRYWIFFINPELTKDEITANINSLIIDTLPGVVPFATYFIFFQESITRTMFINCDEALMQYGFYRRPKDLLEMFRLRVKKLLIWNGIPLLTSIIWLILMKFVYNIETTYALVISLQIISLWVFFTVHTLFIYYLFQPYNDHYEMKHPIYKVINFIVYFISYLSFNMRLSGEWVAPAFIGVAVIYSIVALILVYRLAPKTFKVRVAR